MSPRAVLPSATVTASAPGILLSPLNTWPARSPVNASPAASLPPADDSGSAWCATPSLWGSCIPDSLPVFTGAFAASPFPGLNCETTSDPFFAPAEHSRPSAALKLRRSCSTSARCACSPTPRSSRWTRKPASELRSMGTCRCPSGSMASGPWRRTAGSSPAPPRSLRTSRSAKATEAWTARSPRGRTSRPPGSSGGAAAMK